MLEEVAQDLGLDLKKPLDQRMARLDKMNVTFHAKIGTKVCVFAVSQILLLR